MKTQLHRWHHCPHNFGYTVTRNSKLFFALFMTHAETSLNSRGNDARLLQYAKDNRKYGGWQILTSVSNLPLCPKFVSFSETGTWTRNWTLHYFHMASRCHPKSTTTSFHSFPKHWWQQCPLFSRGLFSTKSILTHHSRTNTGVNSKIYDTFFSFLGPVP